MISWKCFFKDLAFSRVKTKFVFDGFGKGYNQFSLNESSRNLSYSAITLLSAFMCFLSNSPNIYSPLMEVTLFKAT